MGGMYRTDMSAQDYDFLEDPKETGTAHDDEDNSKSEPTQSDARRLYESILNWCFMMVNFEPNQKINTHISDSKSPPVTVAKHNAGQVKGSKSTKAAAGSWILDMIIGPFLTSEAASRFAQRWRSNSRGIQSRRKRGLMLSHEERLTCYNRRLDRGSTRHTDSSAHARAKKGI